jgi:hypothetical protein
MILMMKDSHFNFIINIVLIVLILLSCLFTFLYKRGCTNSNEQKVILEETHEKPHIFQGGNGVTH